eukprot:Rmarinus@m.22269
MSCAVWVYILVLSILSPCATVVDGLDALSAGTWALTIGDYNLILQDKVSVEVELVVARPDTINLKQGISETRVELFVVYNETRGIELFGSRWQALLEPQNLVDETRIFAESYHRGDAIVRYKYFVGTFTHDFDLRTYPYDRQDFTFSFRLQASPGEWSTNASYYLSPLEPSCLGITGQEKSGLDFEEICCSMKEASSRTYSTYIQCSMSAQRIYQSVAETVVMPGIIFVLVSLLSLCYSVKLFMPRIGQTLFCLLTITQFRNSALDGLPDHHYTPFLVNFLTMSLIVIAFILVAHLLAEKLDREGLKDEQVALDKISLCFYPLLYVVLIGFAIADARQAVSPGENAAMTTCLILFLFAAAAAAFPRVVASTQSASRRAKQGPIEQGAVVVSDSMDVSISIQPNSAANTPSGTHTRAQGGVFSGNAEHANPSLESSKDPTWGAAAAYRTYNAGALVGAGAVPLQRRQSLPPGPTLPDIISVRHETDPDVGGGGSGVGSSLHFALNTSPRSSWKDLPSPRAPTAAAAPVRRSGT